MESTSLSQVLILYNWCLIAVVIGVVLLIARFYEKTSGERARYWLFLVPLALFLAGTLRYADKGQIGGDALGGGLWFLGGALQILLCVSLYRQMTRDR
jgi:hypothetical protein